MAQLQGASEDAAVGLAGHSCVRVAQRTKVGHRESTRHLRNRSQLSTAHPAEKEIVEALVGGGLEGRQLGGGRAVSFGRFRVPFALAEAHPVVVQ
jgi:hypothetical protein